MDGGQKNSCRVFKESLKKSESECFHFGWAAENVFYKSERVVTLGLFSHLENAVVQMMRLAAENKVHS